MKTTIGKIVNVYSTLSGAKYSKLKTSERSAIINARRPMKKIAGEFEDFRKDALKDLRPENFEEIAERINEFNAMSEEERKEALTDPAYLDAIKANAEYNNAVDECVKGEFEKEVELDIAPVGRETFNLLLDSNLDWNFLIVDLLEDFLCPVKEEKPESEE